MDNRHDILIICFSIARSKWNFDVCDCLAHSERDLFAHERRVPTLPPNALNVAMSRGERGRRGSGEPSDGAFC